LEPLNFCYWLQGFFELAGTNNLTETQVEVIKDHLKLVFRKETPDRNTNETELGCDPEDLEVCCGRDVPNCPIGDVDQDGYQSVKIFQNRSIIEFPVVVSPNCASC
jgi:hypothetical protein